MRTGYLLGGWVLACACSGQAFRDQDVDGKGGSASTDEVTALPRGGSFSDTAHGGAAGSPAPAGGEGPDLQVPSAGGFGGTPDGAAAAGGIDAGGSGDEGGSGGADGSAGAPVSPPGECGSVVEETWSQGLGVNNRWRLEFGDPAVDRVSRRLVLSRDDIAARNAPFLGGYVVRALVTLQGGTVFTPYPHVKDVMLPSIRRSASGTGIDLGMTQYGASQTWLSSGWPGVPASITGDQLVDVTLYVKNTSAPALALKVGYGTQVYRSSWVTTFTWEETNLALLRYVGGNNSVVFSSTSDRVYVGPLSGCEQLTDAEVDAQFYE